MKKKPDPDQARRFIDAAKELGADENGERFERALEIIIRDKSKVEITASAPIKDR